MKYLFTICVEIMVPYLATFHEVMLSVLSHTVDYFTSTGQTIDVVELDISEALMKCIIVCCFGNIM